MANSIDDLLNEESPTGVSTVKTVADDNSEEVSSAGFSAKLDAEANSEVEVLAGYADNHHAGLLYLTAAANTKARLFDPNGPAVVL